MKRYLFHVNIPAQEWLRIYQGAANQVQVQASCGTRIRIHARHLRPFVTHFGISGWFRLVLDAQNQLRDLQRVNIGKT